MGCCGQPGYNSCPAGGKVPAGLNRTLEGAAEAAVDWRETPAAALVGYDPGRHSWMRPNRRHVWAGVYLPGVIREGVGEIAIAVDCSGSVNARQLTLFEAEVRSILEGQRPERVHVLYFDSEVQKVETYEAGQPVHLNPVGGEAPNLARASSGSMSTGFSRRPSFSDRSVWFVSAFCSLLSHPVGFDREPKGAIRRGHSHASRLAQASKKMRHAHWHSSISTSLDDSIVPPIGFGEGGSLWIRHIAFLRMAPQLATRGQAAGVSS